MTQTNGPPVNPERFRLVDMPVGVDFLAQQESGRVYGLFAVCTIQIW